MTDRPIFATGIASLQDDEDALPVYRVQQLLQFQDLAEELGGLLLGLLPFQSRVLGRIKILELHLAPAL